MNSSTPWHAGELQLQQQIGVVEKMAKIGKLNIRDFMPDQHRDFYSQLSFIVIGTVDPAGNPWAGIRAGTPGFITSPNPYQLQILGADTTDDPMEAGIQRNAAIGLLGIELSTRRRNRVNGRMDLLDNGTIRLHVEQSFGNCPQYIQTRQVTAKTHNHTVAETLTELDAESHQLISHADTFFVASYADTPIGRQVNVSHRGGRNGFVAIEGNDALTVPDFSGNRFFSTLGNILLNQRAGLTFIDFSEGTLLQMSGRAEILDSSSPVNAVEGAERFWRFWPEHIVRRRHALPYVKTDCAEIRPANRINAVSTRASHWQAQDNRITFLNF